ncbi:MAG: ribosome-associated translation inhibitor RaiA [Chlamydiota bacterium]
MVDKAKFKEEEALGYNISIVGRNVLVTEAMKNYAWDKLTKVERLHTHIMDLHMTLDIQKMEHVCVIVAKFDHFKVKVQASSNDMYPSIDKAIDRLQMKLRRWKERIQEHTKKKLTVVDMKVNVLERPYNELEEYNAEIEAANKIQANLTLPKILGTEVRVLKTLTSGEAVMKMDLSADNFLIFRNEVDHKLNVIYRRSDGNYGIIQVE